MLKCVLWDFGDTLADERWMLTPLEGVPEWPEAWSRIAGGELADAWNLGEINIADVISAVAAYLGLHRERVDRHVAYCCSNIRFFEAPFSIARRSTLPRALVTINPDGFSSLVVPRYRLASIFRPIVTSWEQHTLDKGILAERALEHFVGEIRPFEALLIDNKPHCVEAWVNRGGRGYLYRGEETFREDLRGPLQELASSAGRDAG